MTPTERFWSKVEKTSDCWLWMAGKTHDGYGRFWAAGGEVLAHRFAYEAAGGLIADGLQLDHLCRTRHCVNPLHTEPVTCRENLERGDTMAARHASRTHCPQGHPYSGDNLRVYRGKRYCKACRSASRAAA